MTTPRTPTGKRLAQGDGEAYPSTILAIEDEAAAMERERLEAQGWHAPRPDCGPIKARPHEHAYVWTSNETTNDVKPPIGAACSGCDHLYDLTDWLRPEASE